MYIVNVRQAKAELSRLLALVESGEEVVIARRGKQVARLVRFNPTVAKQPDVLKGALEVPDSFFDPLSDDQLDAWEGR